MEYDIKAAYDAGVTLFVSQTEYDLEKLAENAPGIRVIIRLNADNYLGVGADIDEERYGVSPDEAVELLKKAKDLGLEPFGVSGHIGSQEKVPKAWNNLFSQP